jgi:multimeric flavodoxin WrbA
MGIGGKKGEVSEDEEGMKTMKVLGENMAWVMKRLKGTNHLR